MNGLMAKLEIGNKAPSFKLPNQDGDIVSLGEFKGKWVVLYFYPKDMTSGCTVEACDFSVGLLGFRNTKAVVLGVSKDSVESHRKFADKYGLKFNLLADENLKTCKSYGVYQQKSLYGRKFMGIVRSTFVIDPKGVISQIYPKVKVKDHASKVLEYLESL